MRKLLALMVCFLLLVTCVAGAKTMELEVFRDWRGSNCHFKSSRPFFIIRDMYDFENFWKKSGLEETMPYFNFDKYMLLVWNPGPSLFDHHPVKVDRFIYKDGSFIVLMTFERHDTGGYWRRPFVATVLPRVDKGDIFIMKKVEAGYNRVEWKHVYSLWDVRHGRNRPYEVVQFEKPLEKQKFIHTKVPDSLQIFEKDEPEVEAEEPAQVAQTTTQTPTTPTTRTPRTTQTSSRPQKPGTSSEAGADSGFGSFASSEDSAAKAQADDFFPEFGSGDSTQQTEPKAEKPASEKSTQPPGFDEDPLFGEEFDINF
ncbi:MAG: hypothetical protein ACQETH_07325 [Candidatus Rifleibacteriota bacterium]